MSIASDAEGAKQLLAMLCIGLLKQEQNAQGDLVQPVTHLNQYLRHGWEKLCYLCFSQGELPPQTLPAFVRLLHTSVAEWPVIGTTLGLLGYHDPLMVMGQATPFCVQQGEPFVHSYNPRLELEDQYFRRLRDVCLHYGYAEQYTRARTFINRHSIIEDPIESLSADPVWKAEVRMCLLDCYETVPPVCIKSHEGKRFLVLCPHCGWPLKWRREEARCHEDGICEALYGDLGQFGKWVPFSTGMARTKEGVQRYVVAPEISLIALYDRLVKDWGLNCYLFPELDTYDLLIKFPNGKAWAVDVKDHRSAVRLAISLPPFRYFPPWDRAFYVFPEHHSDQAYLNEFGNYWIREKDVSYCGLNKFVEQVREELNR